VKGKESVFSRGEYDNNNNKKQQQQRRREGGGVEEEISVRARKHPEIPTRFFFQILSRCSSRGVCVPLKREREIEIEKKKKKNSKKRRAPVHLLFKRVAVVVVVVDDDRCVR